MLRLSKWKQTFASMFIEKLQQASSDDRIFHNFANMFCLRRANNSSPTRTCRAVELLHRCRLESVCSLFEKPMRINNRLSGFSPRQTIEQFHQARLVRITHGRFAIWRDPFGVLDPKVVVNLLPELHVSVDFMRRRLWPNERFMSGAGWFV